MWCRREDGWVSRHSIRTIPRETPSIFFPVFCVFLLFHYMFFLMSTSGFSHWIRSPSWTRNTFHPIRYTKIYYICLHYVLVTCTYTVWTMLCIHVVEVMSITYDSIITNSVTTLGQGCCPIDTTGIFIRVYTSQCSFPLRGLGAR